MTCRKVVLPAPPHAAGFLPIHPAECIPCATSCNFLSHRIFGGSAAPGVGGRLLTAIMAQRERNGRGAAAPCGPRCNRRARGGCFHVARCTQGRVLGSAGDGRLFAGRSGLRHEDLSQAHVCSLTDALRVQRIDERTMNQATLVSARRPAVSGVRGSVTVATMSTVPTACGGCQRARRATAPRCQPNTAVRSGLRQQTYLPDSG